MKRTENVLKLVNVSVSLSKTKIISNIGFSTEQNSTVFIMGPNGAGKTTVIKAILRDIGFSGDISLFNKMTAMYSKKELAQNVGVLSQHTTIAFPHSVYDIVSLGRYAHKTDMLGRLTKTDIVKISDAMEMTGVTSFKDRLANTLSGGELQRVLLAKLFAQDPKLLILDEPSNHLDFRHQLEIFDILKNWVKIGNNSVLAVVHDFNLAHEYADRIILLSDGEIYADGSPKDALTSDNLRKVYNSDVYGFMQRQLSAWST